MSLFREFARKSSILRTLYEELAFAILVIRRFLESVVRGADLRKMMLDAGGLNAAATIVSKLSTPNKSRELFRIGPQFDGGYFFPLGVGPIDAVFSPGVGGVVDFDIFFANQGTPVFQLDGSIDGPPVNHVNFHFVKKFLNSNYGLEEWVHGTNFKNSKALVLQMDIEGSEWEVLGGSSESLLNQFAVLVVELHGLDEVFTSKGEQKLAILKRILESHSPAHFASNNFVRSTRLSGMQVPPVVEVVLIRKDISSSAPAESNLALEPLKNHPRLPNSKLFLPTKSKLFKI